jgi:ATP-dependent helicase/nuclease subunit B
MEEEDYCRENRPLYFEAAAGMESAGTGNLIDSPEAVCIELPGGERIRIRGRIDRLDETGAPGSGVFSVVDYKTGSTYSFEAGDPFNGGRRVQHCLYLAVAERLLARAHPGARVVSFQYYFPSTREHGERIAWEAEELRDGLRILACLREMAASGCFPFTDDADDVKFSDYLPAFGNVGAMAERCKSRLEGPGNLSLDPLRRLRGYGRIENKGGRDG